MKSEMTRREFVAAATAITVAASATAQPKDSAPKGPRVVVFSKHLQFLDVPAMAKACKEMGVDGVDLAVRKGAHVEPKNLATDFPKAVSTIRAAGLEVPMITTALDRGGDPDAAPILEAAGKLGIPYARIGGHSYAAVGNPLDQLPKITEDLRGLAKIAEGCNVALGYHNHSGGANFGAAIWDLLRVIEAVGSRNLGSNFDAGHATVEGAYAVWRINARAMSPHVRMMAVKDFVWDKDQPKWVPLGQGIVKTAEILKPMHEAGFAGPISMHFEYKTDSDNALLDDMRQAAITLREALKSAGYA